MDRHIFKKLIVLLNDSALHFHPGFSFKNANQKRFTQSPVQDSILLCKCKTRGNASESRKGCEGEVGVKQITPTPLYMSSRGVLLLGGGADGKFILQLYKAEVKSETGTIITVVGECKKVDRERAYV